MSDDLDWEDIDWEDFVFENGVLYLEERNERRFRMFVNIWLRTPTMSFNAFSGNVSDGGVFVATPETLPEGTELNVRFKLPGRQDELDLRGQVRWARDDFDMDNDVVPGFGVKFLDLVSEDRFKLFRYLDDLEMNEKMRHSPD